jgi:hypothetical protein
MNIKLLIIEYTVSCTLLDLKHNGLIMHKILHFSHDKLIKMYTFIYR